MPVETAPPMAGARTWGWWDGGIQHPTLADLAVGLFGVAVLVFFVVGPFWKRGTWMPVWAGCAGLALGLLITVIGLIESFSKIAELGNAIGTWEVAAAVRHALVPTAIGLVDALGGIIATFILWMLAKPKKGDPGGS